MSDKKGDKTIAESKTKQSDDKKSDGKKPGPMPDYLKIGKVSRAEYEVLKRRIVKFEEKNNNGIGVIACNGNKGWCEIGEVSALFYKYVVCEPLGIRVNLESDLDSYYLQYEIGRIRTRGFDAVGNRIKRSGLLKRIVRSKDGKSCFFQLNKTIDSAIIDNLKQSELMRQSGMNAIIPVETDDPNFYQRLMLVAARIHKLAIGRLDAVSRESNGRRLVRATDDLILTYYDLTRIKRVEKYSIERLGLWRRMLKAIDVILMELQIILGLRLWKYEVCVDIAAKILELKKIVEVRIRKEKHVCEGSDR